MRKCFAFGSKLSMPKVFDKAERKLCSTYGGAYKLEALKLHYGLSEKKLVLNMLLSILTWSSEVWMGAECKFLYVWPLLSLCGLVKEKMCLASYGSLEQLALEIHERVWFFFSFNLSCNSQASTLGFCKILSKKNYFLHLQLSTPKVGGQTIKYFTSCQETKSSKACRFQIF